MTLFELHRNVKNALSTYKNDIETVLKKYEPEILKDQKQQLMEGSNALGNDLEPSYLDDPYFKTKEAAQRYAEWKQKKTPNAKRKFKSPNLFINGSLFHDKIKVFVNDIYATVDVSASPIGAKIESKYDNVLGLTPENKLEIRNKAIVDYIRLLKNKLNL